MNDVSRAYVGVGFTATDQTVTAKLDAAADRALRTINDETRGVARFDDLPGRPEGRREPRGQPGRKGLAGVSALHFI
ncbi:hypothetical protein [Paraburkholderia sediminicola]|uniref:hypothetical protein n=1 Tax=Paraburkholderia sediminicola TaxID=458836 RepID=UPI0038B81D7D